MTTRLIVVLVGADIELTAAVAARPGVEVYHVASEDDIDMALLNDLHSPCKLVFVGGDEAKTFAERYGATWIEDGPTANEDLLRFWQSA